MIIIVNFGSEKTQYIQDKINYLGYESQIFHWENMEQVNWGTISGIVLGGSPFLFTENDFQIYIDRFQFLKNSSVPILGICFGHQLLGLLFGSSVYKSEKIDGENNISIILNSKLFENFGENELFVENHTEGITLPIDFEKLASSENCVVEAMKHSKLNIFGVQFHPEVSGENGIKLINNFCELTLSA